LFTRDFLAEGVGATVHWREIDDEALERARAEAASRFANLAMVRNPSEAVTERDLIYPLLAAIGWRECVFVQPNASVRGRADIPDALLFVDDAQLELARREPDDWRRFQHGVCVVEAKRWNRVLDREESGRHAEDGVPSTQMLRYLRRVDDVTRGKLRWGILTNGRVWRLYWQGALSVAEDFLEIDLGKALDLPGCGLDLLDKRPDVFTDDARWRLHALKLFFAMFGPAAFLPGGDGQTFHDLARAEGRVWEARVAKDLSDVVFDRIFCLLADALAKADPLRKPELPASYLAEAREGALILLYRLLFVLYAEDRDLLPDASGPYADYCLTKMRFQIAERKAGGQPFSSRFVTYWPQLTAIFLAIARGDDELGIPPYNGGLFEIGAAPILDRARLSDAVVAETIFALSHETNGDGRGPKYINYRDLSVQQLGSVYERILEFGLRADGKGGVEIDADDEARHKSGSYYTPDDLVTLVIEKTVGPLVAERVAAFKAKSDALAASRLPVAERAADLARADPAVAILALKICDPAMGSGHFLVSLVDWLADEVLTAMAEAAVAVSWMSYVSPVSGQIATVRAKILGEARARRWPIPESQLDDRHVVRRMVLKRVVYGVDKNPMAVELAKVSLWLHSFTVGAPLSFLDHHLRRGDSVVGAFVLPMLDALKARGALFNVGEIARVENVARVMAEIEETTDNDSAEVARSKEKFGVVEEVIQPIEAFFSLLTAERAMGIFAAAPKKAPDFRKFEGKSDKQIAKAREDARAFENAAAFQLVLEGTFGNPASLAEGVTRVAPPELIRQYALRLEEPPEQASLFPAIGIDDRRRVIADGLVEQARALAAAHGFFHWEIGFPNVWTQLASAAPRGGFDAIVGNPPYVRQELLGDFLKRALKESYEAFDGVADLYVYFYEQGLRLLRPGGRMGYVVTNKWLKAGYAEKVRGLFVDKGWLEFVADFGHAKHFFPDADVFPSVLVVRKPDRDEPAPVDADICVIPRDAVPRQGLAGAVAEATFTLPRAMFTKESWVLEPKPVMDLLEKIRRNGAPLVEYAGVKPLYGIKTGLNEAFLINRATRDRLVQEDPACSDFIRPYLRGQDIERWWTPVDGWYVIVLRSSGNFAWPWSGAQDEKDAEVIFSTRFPSLYRHMKRFEYWSDPGSVKQTGLRHREDQGKFWWELRSCDYYDNFERPKILYVDITWSSTFSLDAMGRYINNTAYFIPSSDPWLIAVLNAPIGWAFSWRRAQHGKDEALRYFTSFVERYPIPPRGGYDVDGLVDDVGAKTSQFILGRVAILDWLRLEFDLEKPGAALSKPHELDADGFAAAVRKALPKSRKLSAADIARLKQEHAATVEPARRAAHEALALERRLSDLVNAAYGLTPEDVALMWATAPPRMPIPPPGA
jgi:hypothetical protein